LPSETLTDLLVRAGRLGATEGEETGLRFLDRRERATWASWPEILQESQEVAGSLLALGVKCGERVALIYPTGLEFFHAFFGILLAGAVPTPLYPPVRLGRLDEYHRRTAAMLAAADAHLVLTSKTLRRLLGPTVEAARPSLGCLLLGELPKGEPTVVEVAPQDLALVQFSSGTTVDPKPVALSHRAVLAQVQMLNGHWPKTKDGAFKASGVSWLPLYHDMGLIGCVFPAVEQPGTLTLIGPEVFVTRPAVWLRTLSRYQATISVAPNFAYGLCVEKIRDEELEGVDLSHWHVALNGAEPVAPSVLRAFQKRFAHWGFRPEALTPVYGLSEATLAVTFSDLHSTFRVLRFHRGHLGDGRAIEDEEGMELASVGRPLPEVELKILCEEGQPLAEGYVGRVWAKSPSLMEGYLGRPEATASTLQGGWLDTGDLGFLNGGELFLTSRAKDVIILRGRNHSPVEIEQAMDSVAGARKGCAVAVSHLAEGAGEEHLVLFVEHRAEATEEELLSLPKACAEAALSASGLQPHEVHLVAPGTLPRTSSGKLRRREALRLHLEGELEPPKRVTPFLLAGAMARSALAHARSRKRDGQAG
jgi:acyl-CoA synthetase (AMP-forming)/AMP-acid ligase II